MNKKYHSALQNEISEKIGESYYEKDGNETFVFDVVNDFLKIDSIKNYDLIYSEPAWQQGYNLFQDRAKREKSNYNQYINTMIEIILKSSVPVILIIGKHIIKSFPKPQSIVEIKLHGYTALACAWGIDLIPDDEIKTNYDLIKYLSNKFNHVWDFNAGYGNTGKIFKEKNKKFILTDINPKCIFYINENVL